MFPYKLPLKFILLWIVNLVILVTVERKDAHLLAHS